LEVIKIEKLEINNKARIQAKVKYDDTSETDLIWFDFDKKYFQNITLSGDPWLVCLTPLAFLLGQSLRINNPVDEVLLNNIKRIQVRVNSWYPEKNIIDIEAGTMRNGYSVNVDKTATFFTGGVDSFYVLLEDYYSNNNIDYLIFIFGFDITSKNNQVVENMSKRLLKIAASLSKEIIIITTNLTETRFDRIKWIRNYGFAIAAAALFLDNLYSKVIITANTKIEHYKSFLIGDDPRIVPFFSSSRISFLSYATDKSRMEKIEFLSNYKLALNNLKVCTRTRTDDNCSNCEKCLRTIAAIDVVGNIRLCSTFKVDDYIKKISKIYFPSKSVSLHLWKEIMEVAKKNNRIDLVRAINSSFRKSEIINFFKPLINKLKNKYFFGLGFFIEGLLKKHMLYKKKLS
jgi:hypothetical protein